MKKQPADIILHNCTKNYDQVMYNSWDMVRDRCNCYFSFWAIFCTFTPLNPKKPKFFKKWKKNTWKYHHFTNVYQKLWSDEVRFLRYAVQRMDRQMDRWTDEWTDGQEKWHIEVGAPPKKYSGPTLKIQ